MNKLTHRLKSYFDQYSSLKSIGNRPCSTSENSLESTGLFLDDAQHDESKRRVVRLFKLAHVR